MSIFTEHPYIGSYYLKHPIQWVSHYYYDLKNAWDRANKGYSWCDLSDMDQWFLEIIPSMLREFKETKWGTPNKITEEEWDSILTEMIEHFQNASKYGQIATEDIKEFNKIETSRKEELQKAFDLFIKYFDCLWI